MPAGYWEQLEWLGLCPHGLSSQREATQGFLTTWRGDTSPRAPPFAYQASFSKVRGQAYFHCRSLPKSVDWEGWLGHYCNSHYNNILCSPPNCLLETCFSYYYPVSLIIAPGWRFIILWNIPPLSQHQRAGELRVLPSRCSLSTFLEKTLFSPQVPFFFFKLTRCIFTTHWSIRWCVQWNYLT